MTLLKTRREWLRFAARAWLWCGAISGGMLVHTAWPTAVAEEAKAKTAALLAADTITKDELKVYVDVLADDTFEGREAGSRGGLASGTYLAKQFTELKLQPAGDKGSFFQSFQGASRNILG
jgi:hypothetical protein